MDTTDDPVKKVLILLNDVDPLLNRVTKNKLMKQMGWECIIALSYDEALKAFENENPDVVITEILILDYKDRDGIQLVSDLRSKEKNSLKKVPIIIFSELDEEHYYEKALKNGASACYSKNETSLNNLIRELENFIN